MSVKRLRGQPAKEDAEAVKEVRQLLATHPKWTVSRAARDYAERHPEDATGDSVARRIAGKVRRQMGIPPQARALRDRYLRDLQRALYSALETIEKLIRLERRK